MSNANTTNNRSGRKRSHHELEDGDESLPISKRINSLHIEAGSQVFSQMSPNESHARSYPASSINSVGGNTHFEQQANGLPMACNGNLNNAACTPSNGAAQFGVDQANGPVHPNYLHSMSEPYSLYPSHVSAPSSSHQGHQQQGFPPPVGCPGNNQQYLMPGQYSTPMGFSSSGTQPEPSSPYQSGLPSSYFQNGQNQVSYQNGQNYQNGQLSPYPANPAECPPSSFSSACTTQPGAGYTQEFHLQQLPSGSYEPELGVRENPYYFSVNQMLYEAHLSRVRRLNPYPCNN
ncbi:uncharacterized protein LOC131941355 [Physella acuta]|uniref:uncharacterized protein LOC131941355 n=1 Tax=Physella acuta TaxID=109671 RepID=UPI0027DC1C9B|nr:uncharacterized protein LOC131941355 [Physella acuta]